MNSLVFGPFELDFDTEELRRGAAPIVLRPKIWSTLRYLVENPARLVRKEELLDAIWPDVAVAEETAAQAIRELRRVLGDSTRTPQFIETVHGRGFRWIAAMNTRLSPDTARSIEKRRDGSTPAPVFATTAPSPGIRVFVGRERERERLRAAWQQTQNGTRQVVFLAGEAGLGKTTLAQVFFSELAESTDPPFLASGTCIEHFGVGEPLMPVLEALSRLQRDESGEIVRSALRRYAPAWLRHLPGLVEDGVDVDGSAERNPPALRHLTDALEAIARQRPVVLLIEDAHWSDHATVDFLSHLARRSGDARVLVLCSYRSLDAAVHQHPIRTLHQDLAVHNLCETASLDFLDACAVGLYLSQRCPNTDLPDSFVTWMHGRSDGNPLFLVSLFDAVCRSGFLRYDGTGWHLRSGFDSIGVPERIDILIRQTRDRLSADDRRLIEAGSVAGIEFSAAIVAATLGMDEVICAQRLRALAETEQLICSHDQKESRNRLSTDRFRFVHGLYQEVVVAGIPQAQRARFHLRMATWLEARQGAHAGAVAAEIALHFENGGDIGRAVTHLADAASAAMQRGGYSDAVTLLEHALELFGRAPELNAERELALRNALAAAAVFRAAVFRGELGPQAGLAAARARDLSEHLADHRQKFLSLWVAKNVYLYGAENRQLGELTVKLLGVARDAEDPRLLVLAQNARTRFLLTSGRLVDAEIAATNLHEIHSDYDWQDPEIAVPAHVSALCQSGLLAWLRGRAGDSRQRLDKALAEARRSERYVAIFNALLFAALGAYCCRDRESVALLASDLAAIREPTAAGRVDPFSEALSCWAEQAPAGETRSELIASLDRSKPDFFGATWVCGILADALGGTEDSSAALSMVESGLVRARRTGERVAEPELLRLRGEFLRDAAPAEAEHCFAQAIALARAQGALSWELRGAISLARHQQARGNRRSVSDLLGPILERFPAGTGHPDEQTARDLLREAPLDRPARRKNSTRGRHGD